jgi:hypothetical protein
MGHRELLLRGNDANRVADRCDPAGARYMAEFYLAVVGP